ncbi:MAG: DoxX family protein [Gammaproteobacteria bacterium]|nr:MAG: DoxX family protein [Gammaproteobacteria bacterium]
MNRLTENLLTLGGRLLMSLMFIMAAISKIGGYEGTQGYMESMGVPGMLLPVVIALELGGGLALLLGWQVRLMAFVLAGFTLIAALIFHAQLADQMQSILFTKNLAIAGGLLFISAHGPGNWAWGHHEG